MNYKEEVQRLIADHMLKNDCATWEEAKEFLLRWHGQATQYYRVRLHHILKNPDIKLTAGPYPVPHPKYFFIRGLAASLRLLNEIRKL